MQFKIGKNAPCPCQSGEKYKKCCRGKLNESQEEYYGLLRRHGIIKNKLLIWVSSNFNPDDLDKYVNEFNGKRLENLESTENEVNFFDWFFLECIHREIGEKILKIILDDFDYLFESDELKILKEWMENTQSGVFEIKDINKEDWKLLLRDIFSNKQYEIMDRKASDSVIKGDIIFGRVQRIFSDYYLSGAVTNYPRFSTLDQLKRFVEYHLKVEKKKNPEIDYESFMNSNSKILNDFEPEKPNLVTRDGEDIKICEKIYSYRLDDVEKILDYFESADDFLVCDKEFDKNKFKFAEIACKSRQKDIKRKGRNLVLFTDFVDDIGNKVSSEGSIQIEKNELKVFSMSKKPFERITKRLEKNIGPFLMLKKEKIESLEDGLKKIKNDKPIVKKPKVSIGLEEKILKGYYKDWCYQKIPALNNKTPKEAVKTKEGKEALKKLLVDFENIEEHKKRDGEKYFPVVRIIRGELKFYE